MLTVWVDDGKGTGPQGYVNGLLQELAKELLLKYTADLGVGSRYKHLKEEYWRVSEDTLVIQPSCRYVTEVAQILGLERRQGVSYPRRCGTEQRR